MSQENESKIDLKKLRKKEVFKVPENYFEDFHYRMQMEISSNSPEVSLIDRFIYMMRLRFTIPFLIVCVFSLISIQIELNQNKNLFSDLEIENYLASELQYAQLEDILSLAEIEIEDDPIIINDSELLEYLENESVDEELIYQQFN